jgi:hypothetical protein
MQPAHITVKEGLLPVWRKSCNLRPGPTRMPAKRVRSIQFCPMKTQRTPSAMQMAKRRNWGIRMVVVAVNG